MTPENLPVDEKKLNPEIGAKDTVEATESSEPTLTLEEIQDGAKQIDEIKKEELRQEIFSTPPAPEVTPFGTMSPEGKLFTPQKPEAQVKSIIPSWMKPTWLRKAAAVTGIASAGLAATNAQALEQPAQHRDATSPKIEVIKHEVPEINNDLKLSWNHYVEFLKAKGLNGSHELDSKKKSDEMIKEFRKLNPGTSLTVKSIPVLQEYFIKLREEIVKERKEDIEKQKKGGNISVQIVGGFSPDDIMKNISNVDDIAGADMTSYEIPNTELGVHYNDANKKDESHVSLASLPGESK